MRYLDIEGNEHREKEFDYHHVFAESTLHGRNEKEWGRLKGIHLPLLKVFHNVGKTALHSNVPLLAKPPRELMGVIRFSLYDNADLNEFDRFLAVNEAMHHVAETSENTGIARAAGRIAANLELQTPYILAGQIRFEDDN